MALIKEGTFVEDVWRTLDDDEALPGNGDVIVSLERWQQDRTALEGRNAGLGIRLRSDQLADTITDDIHRFAVIALEFPKFNDGRAFSTARLLRGRHGYEGELRAVGHIIQDQFQFLLRCGFDSVEVDRRTDLETWHKAVTAVEVVYQKALDTRTPIPQLRTPGQAISKAC